MSYRSKIEIVADVIQLCLNGSLKTNIMYKGNLSYEMLQSYLLVCIRAGFIEEKKTHKISYVATENGKTFLIHYTIIKDMLGVHPEFMVETSNGMMHCQDAPNVSYTKDYFKEVQITEEPALKEHKPLLVEPILKRRVKIVKV